MTIKQYLYMQRYKRYIKLLYSNQFSDFQLEQLFSDLFSGAKNVTEES